MNIPASPQGDGDPGTETELMTTTIDRPSLVGVFKTAPHIFRDAPLCPWKVGEFAASTNAHLFVGQRHYGGETSEMPERYKKGERYLLQPFTPDHVCNCADLHRFVGAEETEDGVCEDCGGTGYDDAHTEQCEHCKCDTRLPCELCGGSGQSDWVGPDCDPVSIVGIPVNRRELAYVLAFLPTSTVIRVGGIPVGNEGFRALIVESDEWRFALMSLRDSTHGLPAWPKR